MDGMLTESERAILARVKVGIAGAGGLGSNCAMHLVRSGVRKLVICDFDIVNPSNLNRQFFFRDQIGEKKIHALAANLRRIEPELELELVDRRLDEESLPAVFAACDVVVEAFDETAAKAMFLKALLPTGKRLVTASGMAGVGRSNAMRVKSMGARLAVVGDGESAVDENHPPTGPRVGIAAAMEANCVLAMVLGHAL